MPELKTGSRAQTTSATQATLFSATLDDDTVYGVDAYVVGRDTGGSDRGLYLRRALVYRQGGGAATLEGSVDATYTSETDAGLDATIDVDGNDVRVRVTGLASTTIEWECSVRMILVS